MIEATVIYALLQVADFWTTKRALEMGRETPGWEAREQNGVIRGIVHHPVLWPVVKAAIGGGSVALFWVGQQAPAVWAMAAVYAVTVLINVRQIRKMRR